MGLRWNKSEGRRREASRAGAAARRRRIVHVRETRRLTRAAHVWEARRLARAPATGATTAAAEADVGKAWRLSGPHASAETAHSTRGAGAGRPPPPSRRPEDSSARLGGPLELRRPLRNHEAGRERRRLRHAGARAREVRIGRVGRSGGGTRGARGRRRAARGRRPPPLRDGVSARAGWGASAARRRSPSAPPTSPAAGTRGRAA